jgi:hypothetical protein
MSTATYTEPEDVAWTLNQSILEIVQGLEGEALDEAIDSGSLLPKASALKLLAEANDKLRGGDTAGARELIYQAHAVRLSYLR